MKKHFLLSLIVLLIASVPAKTFGQSFFKEGDNLVNGYGNKLSGVDYEYHSCIQGLRQSLIVRAVSGNDFMEWQTDAATATHNSGYHTFVWISALGSGPGRAKMILTTDNGFAFDFYTDARPKWEVPGADGSSLSFNSIMTDQYGDHHGYMILRIPVQKMKYGEKLKIKVTGSLANLSSWYMTFKMPVKTGVTFRPFPALLKQGKARTQLVQAGIFYFGNDCEAKIFNNNKLISTTNLKFGYNSINLGFPEVVKPTKTKVKIKAGAFELVENIMLKPVRPWEIKLIQHSHTDIGYTRSQTEILAEHLRYIDYALDYCDATDAFDANAKFKWVCEASWPVETYLKTRPKTQIDRLKKRIEEGRIEVTGMYFNFDELPDEGILASSLKAVSFIKNQGIPIQLAMQNDVNGIGWCLNYYFKDLGVKYLSMGTHGHRALICFDYPTFFWWESPSGNRMLAYRGEHYMIGNTLFELQTKDIDRIQNNIFNYLMQLEDKKYPFNEIAIQHSGYLTDNSPPSTTASEVIEVWNKLFEWPKLSTSLASTFFSEMESKHSSQFEVIRGAWPDWWTDGYGASARESAVNRNASAQLKANTGGLVMASIMGCQLPDNTEQAIDLTDEALLFYSEHTLGYSESVREPFSQPTMDQRALKESYAWEANRRTASIGETSMGLLQSKFNREKDPSLLVFNTLNWNRSGLLTVYIDHEIVPQGKMAGIFDSNGHRMKSQPISHRSDGSYWAIWVEKIPSFGYKKLSIKPLNEPLPFPDVNANTQIENDWYKVIANPAKGTLSSIYDKQLKKELVDNSSSYQFGEFILEELANRQQIENKRLDDYKRSPLDKIWFDALVPGDIYNTIRFIGESETTINPRGFTIEYRIYNTEKRIDIFCSMIKNSITNPESFYLSFPFKLDGGKHFTSVPGGTIEAGVDQIKGSSNDWYVVQEFASVRNEKSQIIIGSLEMPLFQLGAINTGRYIAGALPQSTHLFSWPMNNYWTTNFNAEQRGGHSWLYYMTSSDNTSNSKAAQFGWGARVPFLTRVIPGNGTGDNNYEGSMLNGLPANVLLVSAKPKDNGNAFIVQIRELDGLATTINLTNGITGSNFKIRRVDVNGNRIENQSTNIMPFESAFFELKL